ncbi:MAG: [FeFe] hydrogenase H-cluster maturation GTPase HydF [Clostridia bacterium]|nr:[FeFe] hydrogenase H-cluster maturation GTPase HydF [Clostridia bacterium]
MSLNSTPSAERVHIGFFGRRNAGKSSVVNAVTNQEMSLVSDVAGTTTDPVYKAMELLPFGPVVIMDTPGYDDEGALGQLRVKKTKEVLNRCDVAVLVVDSTLGVTDCDETLIAQFKEKEIPYLIVYNKGDLTPKKSSGQALCVSAKTGEGIYELKEALARLAKTNKEKRCIVGDLLTAGDTVVLVTPIDDAAPKGRLILPQQQTLRDILDADAVAVVTKETTLPQTLKQLKTLPAMVITDSQVFDAVSKILDQNIPLTSFSILMAKYKGYLQSAVAAIAAIEQLSDGDTVLIAEGCTHHRQCNDIGTVKIPNWLRAYTKKDIRIETASGTSFPEDLSRYAIIIHCGACMLNEREVRYRLKCAQDAGVPMTNYGVLIAYMQGILPRSLALFPEIRALLKK